MGYIAIVLSCFLQTNPLGLIMNDFRCQILMVAIKVAKSINLKMEGLIQKTKIYTESKILFFPPKQFLTIQV